MDATTKYGSGEVTLLAALLDLAMEHNLVARQRYAEIYGVEWAPLPELDALAGIQTKSDAHSTTVKTVR